MTFEIIHIIIYILKMTKTKQNTTILDILENIKILIKTTIVSQLF